MAMAHHIIQAGRDFRETCSVRTVLPLIQSTAALNELS
jgi:hypothetical protein